MFSTSTINTNRNTNRSTAGQTGPSNRRTAARTLWAFTGLAIIATACGGTPTTDSADSEVARPAAKMAASNIADSDSKPATPAQKPADEQRSPELANVSNDSDFPVSDATATNPPTDVANDIAQQPEETPAPNDPPADNPGEGDEPENDTPPPNGDDGLPPNGNPGPIARPDFGTINVIAPELKIAPACFASSNSLTWTASGVNELVLDDRLGNLIAVRTVRGPLIVTRDDSGGPLLTRGIKAKIDQLRGFFLQYQINGRISDIDVAWQSNTTESGSHTSPVFVSELNPLCFVQVALRIDIADGAPAGPIDQPGDLGSELDPGGNDIDSGDNDVDEAVDFFEVGVRKVKLRATAECFSGPLATRVFDTGAVPVTVVVDTYDASELLTDLTTHKGTELNADLQELAISTEALRATARRDLGYQVHVQLQGFFTGGIVIEYQTTVTEPGRQSSPVFSSPSGDCDVFVNFTVVEIDD